MSTLLLVFDITLIITLCTKDKNIFISGFDIFRSDIYLDMHYDWF